MDSGRDDEGFLFLGKSFYGGGGPVGLDYHRPYSPKQAHLHCCRSHVELAKLIGAGGPRWMDSVGGGFSFFSENPLKSQCF